MPRLSVFVAVRAIYGIAKGFDSHTVKDDPRFTHLQDVIAAHATAASEGEWAPQALSNTVWSMAKLMLSNRPLLEALATRSIPRIWEFKSQDLAMTAWSCAALLWHHCPLLERISKAALPTSGTDASLTIDRFRP